ncbi:MAG TPA: AAA family ATPase, partial [Phaeodactylibacter sp.]|nr:AAA family ATPase [Phaeodactylibacter sp.]
MESLFDVQARKLRYTPTKFVRSLMYHIDWNARMIGIRGARGVGKTTLLLQYIKLNFKKNLEKALYVSLDNVWFSNNGLYELADNFVKKGGTHLFVDEVHKYPNWSQEMKNIYDDFPNLKIVFTGSSLLEILNARADLSRRAITYKMQGLSFREYISIETGKVLESYSIEGLIANHQEISPQITAEVKPFQYFDTYLKYGYYPFYREQRDLYFLRLQEIINMTLEIELPQLRKVDVAYIHKLKQLLLIISESVPFTANISKLSNKTGIARATLLSYFHFLEESDLLINLYKQAKGISKLQKPNKTYLNNTNLMYALSPDYINKGNIRETFFVSQMQHYQINYSDKSDFLINNKYTFEIG